MNMIEGHIDKPAPAGVESWDIDPYSDDVLHNIRDYYAELRARGPFVHLSRYGMLACGRYDETREVFSDWENFVSSRGVGLSDFKLAEPWRPPSIVLEVDPPYHTKTRTAISRALSPRAVANVKEMFEREAEALVDRLLEKGSFDAVTDLAEAYPLKVFPDAVGISPEGRENLLIYGPMVFNALGPDNQRRREHMAMAPKVGPWIAERCNRAAVTKSGFAATIYQSADDGKITEDEAGMLVRSLLSAGVDTTVTALGNTVLCLARHADQFEKLKSDPSLARNTFEEAMRYEAPIHSFARTANRPAEVSGIAIEEGTKILCVLGSANLDSGHWPDADTFDITRRATGHLALGIGVHGCVGQSVARQEGDAVLSAIARKVGTIELTGDPVWRPNNALHALDKLPVTFKA